MEHFARLKAVTLKAILDVFESTWYAYEDYSNAGYIGNNEWNNEILNILVLLLRLTINKIHRNTCMFLEVKKNTYRH